MESIGGLWLDQSRLGRFSTGGRCEYVKRKKMGFATSNIRYVQRNHRVLDGYRANYQLGTELENPLALESFHAVPTGLRCSLSSIRSAASLVGLFRDSHEGQENGPCCDSIGPTKDSIPTWQVPLGVLCAFVAIFIMGRWGHRVGVELSAFLLILAAGALLLTGYEDGPRENDGNGDRVFPREYSPQHDEIVPQKQLTRTYYWGTVIT